MTDTTANASPAAPETEPVAKPWYLSKTMISLLAGMIMAAAPKVASLLHIPIPITVDQANAIVYFVIPQAIAFYGRATAKHVLTSNAANAVALNQAAIK